MPLLFQYCNEPLRLENPEMIWCMHRDRGIYCTYLLRQLMEEEFGEVCYARLCVFQAEGNGADVSLHLHHIIENKVAEDSQRVLSHQNRLINQSTPRVKTSAYIDIVYSIHIN